MKPIPFNSRKDLAPVVFDIYGEFIAIYLNVLRQKEGKPQDWFPQSLSIDPAWVDEMRHFFSDYQHITKAFLTLNKQMDELRGIDKDKQPNLYQHKVDGILGHGHRQPPRCRLPGGLDEINRC